MILYTRNVHRLAKFQPAFLPSGTTTAIGHLQQCPLQTEGLQTEGPRETVYYLRNTKAHSWNNRCIGRAIIITYSECVSLALIIQHAKRMRRIIFSSVACLDVLRQGRTQEFCSRGGGSTNSVEDREKGDLAAVAPSQGF